jgi:hypothetical protein
MRGPKDSKSDTCREDLRVCTTGISRKVDESYSGRSANLPLGARGVARRLEEVAEVSREHSSVIATDAKART